MVSNNFNKLKHGFTLFEMVIVVGIISILTGISFTYYGKYAEGKKLEAEARKFSNTVSLALKNASSANQESCNNFVGFNMSLDSINNRWFLQRCCNLVSSCSSIATYNLENNVKVYSTVPQSLVSIFFNRLGRGIVFNNNEVSQNAVVTLKNNSLDAKNCINIDINKAGVINIGERVNCVN